MKKRLDSKLYYLMTHPWSLFQAIVYHTPRLWSDSLYLKIRFRACMGYPLNLNNPKTYSEKLQWLKLYDRQTVYTKMVDKVEAKKYVSKIIGDEYIVPTVGVWDSPEQIDWDLLPKQFVLKTTHDSGTVIVVKDKSKLDVQAAIKKLNSRLKFDYWLTGREWPYKDVPHRIIAEKYIDPYPDNDLRDYKLFCFNGKMKAMFIASERFNKQTETRFDFFDRDFNHLPFTNGHPNAEILPSKPQNFEEMIRLAEKLSENISHLRVDFYEVGEKIYFGELTFSHWSGLVPFEPREWDYKFGEWISLPTQKRG